MNINELLLSLLAGGVVVISVMKYLRLPTMLGYLVLGTLVGPNVFNVIEESKDASELAELGIMALMFSLGLKFSFSRLLSSRRLVFGLGGLQVASCLVVTTLVAHFIAGLELRNALIVAAVLTMSSTAVVSKMIIERGELKTPQGTRTISVLIFQDLAVIPMLILFSHDTTTDSHTYISDFLGIGLLLFFLLVVAPRIMPKLVDYFARQQSDELFTIFVLCMVVGISHLTHSAGLSAVLGAFVTGILLAESRHRYLIEEIIRPYREIFLGFFFVSIGLLVAPNTWIQHLPAILGLTIAVLVLKPLIIYALIRLVGSHRWTAIHASVALGGTGEFGFVLLTAAATSVDNDLLQILLATNLVAMIMPPILLPIVERLRTRLSNDEWLLQARDLTRIASTAGKLSEHVILCGFGQGSSVITKLLDRREIPWLALENNHEIFASKGLTQSNVVFGDARQPETLIAAGILQAKTLIVTHHIHSAAVQTIHAAHQLNPQLPIIAKVQGEKQIDEVSSAGATFLSIAAIETGSSMASKALQIYGVSNQAIAHDIREMHGRAVDTSIAPLMDVRDDDDLPRLREHRITSGWEVCNKPVAALEGLLHDLDVQLISLVRDNQRVNLEPDIALEDGDIVYLRGNRHSLETVAALLAKSKN